MYTYPISNHTKILQLIKINLKNVELNENYVLSQNKTQIYYKSRFGSFVIKSSNI